MKQGTVLKEIQLKKGRNVVTLDGIYPLTEIKSPLFKSVNYFINDHCSEIHKETIYANKIVIEAEDEGLCRVILGKGYYAQPDLRWTDMMLQNRGWMGGDGIYSFNLENGNDAFDQDKIAQTLFVFGDTFVGRGDLQSKKNG